VYWTEFIQTGQNYNYTLKKVALAGGTGTAVATGPGSTISPMGLDATNAYFPWTDDNDPDAGTVNGVAKAPLAGGTATTLASGSAVDGPDALAVDSTDVYYGNGGNASLMRVPIAGGTAVTLNNSQPFISAIAVDSSFVYWTCPFSNAVLKLAK
jgi:hypothetical protein